MSAEPAELLRAHGLHVTAQRLSVIRAVQQSPHATANELAVSVRDDIGAISRQAVYDALTVLAREGIIRVIQPAGSAARYETRVADNHHHLVCRSCDRVVDVDCAAGDVPCLIPSDASDFTVDEAEVIYWGTCPDCTSATAASAPGP